MRSRWSQQTGFTLIELLVATSIGMVIVLAAFGLADSAVRSYKKADDRTDVTQRGRLGLEIVARALRSQTCPVGSTSSATSFVGAFVAAEDTRAVFWADLGRTRTGVGWPDPSIDGFTYANGTISEIGYAGNNTASTPTLTPIVTDAVPSNGSASVLFQYFMFNPSYDPAVTNTASQAYGLYRQMTTPVATADLSKIVKVRVAFKTYPRGGSPSNGTTAVFSDEAMLRAADIPRRQPVVC
jgi:Tfp pilus assembly protein PilW